MMEPIKLGVGLPWLLLTGLLAACAEAPPAPSADAGAPVVYTTFHPTTYFVERLADGLVEVVCPLPADADGKTLSTAWSDPERTSWAMALSD